MMKEWILKIGVFGLGLLLVFVSLARASYEIWAKEIEQNSVKNRNTEFLITFDDGMTQPATYNFPEVGMLPSSPFYGFKKIRDWIWIKIASGDKKASIVLLLADKKMTEANDLISSGQNLLAIEAGNEAIDNLEYANKILDDTASTTDKKIQLKKQIFLAGYAYKEILSKLTNTFDLDQQKYNDLINKLDIWNEKQAKERYSWEN